jgi:hypothetical protein
MRRIAMLLVIVLSCLAQRAMADDQLTLPENVRAWFRNPDGSCVQCSIGMAGVWQNFPAASYLLWDTEFGKAVRGGSYPSRVEKYCDARRIPVYNITGEGTYDWMKWASKTGRMSAIGAGTAHFQTLVYYDATPGVERPWCVCNNNSPTRIDRYTEAGFRRLHESSGKWVVILKTPAPPPQPRYVKWW